MNIDQASQDFARASEAFDEVDQRRDTILNSLRSVAETNGDPLSQLASIDDEWGRALSSYQTAHARYEEAIKAQILAEVH